jgi:hypothetical protein
MKVKIGKYKNWVGPYQIAELLKYVGVSKDRCHDIGGWLVETPLNPICQWIHDKSSRKIKVKLHNYDTWSMDNTLSHIILPMLKQLKAIQHGAGYTDDEDVPFRLRRAQASDIDKLEEWGTDDNHFKRWNWIMDEMIWAFNEIANDNPGEEKFSKGVSDPYWQAYAADDTLLGEPRKLRDRKNGNVDKNLVDHYQIVDGPNHTRKTDYDGLKEYWARIRNGTRLFGKYYQNLWD